MEKEEQTKLQISGGKEIKITAEMNEIETKETLRKIDETKNDFFEQIKLTNLIC